MKIIDVKDYRLWKGSWDKMTANEKIEALSETILEITAEMRKEDE